MSEYNAKFYLSRGNVYAKIGKYETAIDDFNEAIKSLRTLWHRALVFLSVGHFYAKIGHAKNAAAYLIEAGRLQQNYHKWTVAAFYNRYSVYLEMGNTEKANEDINEIKELNSELVEDSSPSFLFSIEMVPRDPDMYLYPPLHGWEVDLSPSL